MPLTRRIPKRGFNNANFRVEYQVVGLDDLAKVGESEITREALAKVGLVKLSKGPVKLLANGEVTGAFTLRGIKASGAAREKIVAAGGRIEE